MKKFNKFLILFAFLGLSSSAVMAQTYTIYNDGNVFRSNAFPGYSTTAQGALEGIMRYANMHGQLCTIQLGNGGSDVLNLNNNILAFDNYVYNGTSYSWGPIFLTGKALVTTGENDMIRLIAPVPLYCQADLSGMQSYTAVLLVNWSSSTIIIANKRVAVSSNALAAVSNNSTGTISVTGGEVQAEHTVAIRSQSSGGSINISGGSVEGYAAGGRAIHNISTGSVNISGGVVKSYNWIAVDNGSSGKITVSGSAMITSAITDDNYGAIFLNDYGASTLERLTVTGGTIQNTAAGGYAIRNNSVGTVKISNGTVKATATNGIAIANMNSGALNITGGTVSATGNGGSAIYNGSTGAVNFGSAGNVSATTGEAIINNTIGKIFITANTTATITSANPGATIWLAPNGQGTGDRLEIKGGTVKNTATGTAINNSSPGGVKISGGTVTAITGVAIQNDGTGKIAIEGGTVSATGAGGRAIYNHSTGAVNISGGAISSTTGITVDNGTTGKITVSGNASITSANTNTDFGTIFLYNDGSGPADRLEINGGTVKNTAAGGNAIRNNSLGGVKITGGTVTATTGAAVRNNNTGALNVSGGTVSATGANGRAVFNTSTGAVNISGNATLSSTTGITVDNSTTGKITVSGNASITSANTNNWGTIFLANGGTTTGDRLEINGGTIKNTAAGGNAVCNGSIGGVKITNGTVTATTGVAVWNDNTGALNVSGGTLSATGANGRAIFNNSTGAVNISGGAVSSTTGIAVENGNTGKITVSGNAAITSTISGNSFGTIFLNDYGTATAQRLEVTGGMIKNTGNGGSAIYNASTGEVKISGGTVHNAGIGGYAIRNSSTGTVNISGSSTKILATGGVSGGTAIRNVTGTINISDGDISAETVVYNTYSGSVMGKLNISGGTLSSDGANKNSRAIYNTGTCNITGGMIRGRGGYAVYNTGSGTVAFSKGIVYAQGTSVTDVINTTYSDATASSVVVAWNKAAGTTNYAAGSTADLFKYPSTVTAVWAKQGTINGISAIGGSSNGFIPIDGISINGSANFYTVTFAGESVSISPQTIEEGGTVSKPADPVRAGYTFDGWFTDNDSFTDEWDFATDVVTADLTLWAKWTLTPAIVSVTIDPKTVIMQTDESQQFTATVVAVGGADETITWSVSGNTSSATTVSEYGYLSVGANETSTILTVKAASITPTVYDEAAVTIILPKVVSIIITPKNVTVTQNGMQEFTTTVVAVGGADETVTWILSGNTSTETLLSDEGLLSVGSDEAAATITVKAASVFDPTISDETTVTILEQNIVSLTISPKSATVQPEGTQQFTATVVAVGGADESIMWSLSGNMSTQTNITPDGLLTVGTNEIADTITVRATSLFNLNIFDEAIIIIGEVGIVETLHASSVQVYPNPTTGELRIENGELRIESVDIFDIYGKKLYLSTRPLVHLSTATIDISHLPAGIYFVKIHTENGVVTKKVVKE